MKTEPWHPRGAEDGPAVIRTILADWWDFFGFRAIWERVHPPHAPSTRGRPATMVLWIVVLYSVTFGIARGRYEYALYRIEKRQTGIQADLKSERWREALEQIPRAQVMLRPRKPEYLEPLTVIESVFGAGEIDSENVDSLMEVVVSFKADLSGANLGGVVLILGDLSEANLSGAKRRVKPIELGSANDVSVGSDAHAIGHPTGGTWTYTKGIVSQIRLGYEWTAAGDGAHVAPSLPT